MADPSPQRAHESQGQKFIRGAGEVRDDPEHRLWGPAKWVVQLVQYLVAIIMLTIGEGIKSIFSGDSKRKKRASKET